jgi:hypothetical protein
LNNVNDVTAGNQIGLAWDAPTFDGGSPVLDYNIWYDNAQGGDLFFELVTVTDLSYTA